MKASEARNTSKQNEASAAERQAAEWAEYKKKERARLRAEHTKENEILKWELEACRRQIKEATQRGIYHTKMEVAEKIAKRLASILIRDGFAAKVNYNTVFTGVDEWQEDYYIEVSWDKIYEH
jgi:hypothetical protein